MSTVCPINSAIAEVIDNLDQMFDERAFRFGPEYSSDAEKMERMAIWRDNKLS